MAFLREGPDAHPATGAKGCPVRGTSPSPSDAEQWSCIDPWAGSGLPRAGCGQSTPGDPSKSPLVPGTAPAYASGGKPSLPLPLRPSITAGREEHSRMPAVHTNTPFII